MSHQYEMPPTYRGKRLADMTREELEQAIIQLGKSIEKICADHRDSWDWLDEIEEARLARQRRGWYPFANRH